MVETCGHVHSAATAKYMRWWKRWWAIMGNRCEVTSEMWKDSKETLKQLKKELLELKEHNDMYG